MLTILTILLVFYCINMDVIDGPDHLPALMTQIGQEYVQKVASCRIIQNAYINYKQEMMNFRRIQRECTKQPRKVGYNEACAFLMKPARDDKTTTKHNFIRTVYVGLRNAADLVYPDQLTHTNIVNAIAVLAELSVKKAEYSVTCCQHWSTMTDLCRGDNDEYNFGSYLSGYSPYTDEDMEKVYSACRALGLRSTRALPPSQGQSSQSSGQ